MATILALSSKVARGAVGLSAIVPALHGLGHTVIELPTVLLSNHPGHGRTAGMRVAPDVLRSMLDAIDAHGWLGDIDAVLTGYLPSADHVAFAVDMVRRVKAARPTATVPFLCDPVLGDDPKGLYIDAAAAAAVRDDLIPLATIATPNRFELSWLKSSHTPRDIRSPEDAWAAHLDCDITVGTSIPSGVEGETTNAMYARGSRALTRVPLRANAPNGTGDLFSALLLARFVETGDAMAALAAATAGVDAALTASAGRDQLDVTRLGHHGDATSTWPVECVERGPGEEAGAASRPAST